MLLAENVIKDMIPLQSVQI